MRRLILVVATMGVTVLLASGVALGITGGWADDGLNDADTLQDPTVHEPEPWNIIKYPNVGAMVDPAGFDVGGIPSTPTARALSSRPPSS